MNEETNAANVNEDAATKTRKPRQAKPITGYTIRKAFEQFQELCRQGRNAGLEIAWTDADGEPLTVQPGGMKIRGYSEY